MSWLFCCTWRLPVGYFFTKGFTDDQLYDLSMEVIKSVEEAGFVVTRLAGDNCFKLQIHIVSANQKQYGRWECRGRHKHARRGTWPIFTATECTPCKEPLPRQLIPLWRASLATSGRLSPTRTDSTESKWPYKSRPMPSARSFLREWLPLRRN